MRSAFQFGKKKEKETTGKAEGSKVVGKQSTSVSNEEIKHLEETKYRLFGQFTSKKREKSPSSKSQQPLSHPNMHRIQVNGESSNQVPPSKPPRLSSFPTEDCDNFHPLKTFNIPGLNLPILNVTTANERILTFHRQSNGDFPFSLRRAVAIDRTNNSATTQRAVIFVEHENKQGQHETPATSTLLHGDQLVAINGTSVEKLSREEIVDVIRKVQGDEITLQVKQMNTDSKRTVHFKRQPNGDFGFLLRRSHVVDVFADGSKQQRTIVLAEPSSHQIQPSSIVGENLAPDQLIAVNGRMVETMTRDELTELIGSNAGTIQLTVKSSIGTANGMGMDIRAPGAGDADFLTFCDSSPSRLPDTIPKNEVAADAERVWLVHRDGYAAGVLVDGPNTSTVGGKLRVRLIDVPGDVLMDVDAVDVEKANPPNLDRVDDLAKLLYLNESSVIHLLRQRHASSLINTYAGSMAMLITKPQVPLAIYSDKVVQLFKGCRGGDAPPHIYAIAQKTYRSMIANRRSQALIFTGRSGAGKTVQFKHFLHYLCLCSGKGKVLTPAKAMAMFKILEAFGNCETWSNKDASRFITFLTVDFDHIGEISAALLQCLLLEYSRVVRRSSQETNFQIFSHFLRGATEEMKRELFLHELDDISAFIGQGTRNVDSESYHNDFEHLLQSFEILGFSLDERQTIFSILASILHLWTAGATKGLPSFKSTFLKPIHAQRAAELLGVSLEELQKNIFINTAQQTLHDQVSSNQQKEKLHVPQLTSGRLAMGRRRVTPFKSGGLLADKLSITDRPGDGVEALEAFLIGLYRELFSLVVSLINRSLSSNYRTVTSITLIDYPGYQYGPDRNSGFNEFCFNYVNERIHAFHHDSLFHAQMEIYRQEKIDIDFQLPSMSPASLVDIIDAPMQQHVLKSTNLEARSQEKRGLLWLLDEESIFPGATDESLIERIFVHYNESGFGKYLTKNKSSRSHFILRHAFGTFPVSYNVHGWVRFAQENPVTRQALSLLQESSKNAISSLFVTLRSGGIPGGQTSGFVDNASLRRTTAVYKTLTAPQAMKRRSNCAVVKMQMDYLIENLRRCGRISFVHCLNCIPPIGQSDTEKKALHSAADMDVQYLRSQLRSVQITDAVRFDKSGYPERMLFSEFRRRFECLSPHAKTNGVASVESRAAFMLDHREAVDRLLRETFEVDQSQAVLGVNYVFMKSQFLASLEDQRDQKLSSIVTLLQAQCRTLVAKERLKKRRIQDTAIRCIQKNINKYLAVRAWPWWRLYTKILPLVGVQKTEDDIKAQQEELESLRGKYKKLEKQYSELRLHCDRLEARLEASQSEVSDERATVSQVSETLEEENKLRLRAEKELAELKMAHATMEKRLQKLELETMEHKKIQLLSDDGQDGMEMSVDDMKEKFKELRLQLTTERKQREIEKKEEVEQQRHLKQKYETKVGDLQKELEENQKELSAQRRLAEKSRDETQDLRLHIQQLSTRNADLEKRQRKFDAELQSVKGAVDMERVQKDRLQKEHQSLTSECLRLEAELRNVKDELDDYQTKCEHLSEDNRILSEGQKNFGKESEQQLRLQKQNLERKCVEQEAELDDLSGELQQLQQRITRLEMQNEKLRQENAKEAEKKEEEFDELRAQHQRRIRMLEEQVEDEQHHKEHAQRKIKDLENRLREVEETPAYSKDNENEITSLKRQLKKVKALLKDSQLIVEQYEKNFATKNVIKQLKNELEDANAAKLSAMKIRQNLENELDEIRTALVAAEAAKAAADDRVSHVIREKTGLEDRLSDLEQEVQDLLKKYKAQVQQSAVDHIRLADQIQRIADLENEKDTLQDKVNELTTQLERKEASSVDKHKIHLAESKIRQLESKFELECAARVRAEANQAKVKEQVDSLKEQLHQMEIAKERDSGALKRIQNQYSQQNEEFISVQRREADLVQKQRDLDTTVHRLEEENARAVADLKLALRRIDDLQAALRDDLDEENEEEDELDLDDYLSDEDLDENGIIEGTKSIGQSRPSSGSTQVT